MYQDYDTSQIHLPSSLLLPSRMSTSVRSASAIIVIGSAVIKTPSMVGADGKPRIPAYEFHCCTDIVFASTARMQAITSSCDSCK